LIINSLQAIFRGRKMKILRFSRTRIIGLLAVLGFLFSVTSSFAAGATLTADITINRVPLAIAPLTNLTLAVNAPTTGSQIFIVGAFDGSCGSCISSTNGSFRVTGNEGSSIAFDALAPATPCTGGTIGTQGTVTMSNLKFADPFENVFFPGDSFLLTAATAGDGFQDLNWGASITASSDVSGIVACTQDIAMNYNP
jgi:hypothetical protein